MGTIPMDQDATSARRVGVRGVAADNLFLSLIFAAAMFFVVPESSRADCSGWLGFRTPVRYASEATQAVFTPDLNGDGIPDIMASGNHVDERSAFSMFLNRGDGTFGAPLLVASGLGEELEAVRDLNGDHIPDILASNYWSNGIVIHRGLGELRFESGVPYATATHGGPSFVVDYDHDGIPDVLSLSFGSGNPVRLHLFRGDASGGLGPKRTFETSLANGATPSLRNHDGALEILVSERSGHLAVLRYSDDALTVSSITITPNFDLSSVFADVNGDGIEDIIYTAEPEPASETNEPLAVMLANRDGSFGERIPLPMDSAIAFPFRAQVSDFDGDGRADIIVSDFHSANLYFFRGDGAGHFEEGHALDAGGPVNTFIVEDMNSDGKPDIVTGNADKTISVLLNRGTCELPRRRVAKR